MTSSDWLLLVTMLPGRNQALRMRVWRALKAAGAGALRDGVYLLPRSTLAQQVFTEQAADVAAGGGSAQVLRLGGDAAQQAGFAALFDRTPRYTEIARKVEAFSRTLRRLGEPEARRRLAALRKDAATLADIDFFPGRARQQLEEALVEAELALNARFSPAEPRASARPITPRRRQDYQRRLWATRQRPWVDRLCSAWLIRRFIDPKARFVWLKSPADLPRNAVGFDFEGAEFAHAGSRVTFQVLAASFGLEADEALAHLGRLVHYLDVGGMPVPEARGLATILAGARAAAGSDDDLLDAVFPVIDHLHAGFRCAQTPPSSRPASAPSPPRARRRPASSPSAARSPRT